MDWPSGRHLLGTAGLEVLIAVKGDDPELDGIVRRRVADTRFLCLGSPAEADPSAAHLLHCEVPLQQVTISMLPVFTRIQCVAAAVEMNPSWQSLHVLAMEGAIVLQDVGPDEWLGINPWSGHEFKLSPLSMPA